MELRGRGGTRRVDTDHEVFREVCEEEVRRRRMGAYMEEALWRPARPTLHGLQIWRCDVSLSFFVYLSEIIALPIMMFLCDRVTDEHEEITDVGLLTGCFAEVRARHRLVSLCVTGLYVIK
jgi:hypothetical protein